MALLCLLAVVMCELLPRLHQSTRISRGIADLQASGHFQGKGMTAVIDDGSLLACKTHPETDFWEERLIIQGKDKHFVEYDYAVDNLLYEESTPPIICKPFALPPKPSSALRNLTTPPLPQDVIGMIAASIHGVQCESCRLFKLNMTFFERCRAALALNQWARVNKKVKEEGGSCEPSMSWKWQTLQSCMASPKANEVAVCRAQSTGSDEEFIKRKENSTKTNEEAIEAHQRAMKNRVQEHQVFIKKKQETIKNLQDALDMSEQNLTYLQTNIEENQNAVEEHQRAIEHIIQDSQGIIKERKDVIKDLQDALEKRKQNIVYLQQIFEGP